MHKFTSSRVLRCLVCLLVICCILVTCYPIQTNATLAEIDSYPIARIAVQCLYETLSQKTTLGKQLFSHLKGKNFFTVFTFSVFFGNMVSESI